MIIVTHWNVYLYYSTPTPIQTETTNSEWTIERERTLHLIIEHKQREWRRTFVRTRIPVDAMVGRRAVLVSVRFEWSAAFHGLLDVVVPDRRKSRFLLNSHDIFSTHREVWPICLLLIFCCCATKQREFRTEIKILLNQSAPPPRCKNNSVPSSTVAEAAPPLPSECEAVSN